MKIFRNLSIVIAIMFLAVGSVYAMSSYFNGFEINTDGWFGMVYGISVTQTESGADGIMASAGSYYAKLSGPSLTRWGQYENTFPADGYITKTDVYLDMSLADGTDREFDYSSAINQPDGTYRRDFVFNVGTVPGVQATNQWIISASNKTPGSPSSPDQNPVTVSQSGWYTFEHTFQKNSSGILVVTMILKNNEGNVLGTWTLSDPSDIVGTTVGGNRYGAFTRTVGIAWLAIDNSDKHALDPIVGTPDDKEKCKQNGWQTFVNPAFKNQGECISYVNKNQK